MKKNLFAMIVVILSGAAANATCYGLRNGETVCHPNVLPAPVDSIETEKISCKGFDSSLAFKFSVKTSSQTRYVDKYVGYNYTYTTYGHCPSRLCGSIQSHTISTATGDEGVETFVWKASTLSGDVTHLALTNSADSSKNFTISYQKAADGHQVLLQTLVIGANSITNPEVLNQMYSCEVQ